MSRRNDDQIVDVTDTWHDHICEECDALLTLDTVFVVDDYFRDGSSARLCDVCAYHGALHE